MSLMMKILKDLTPLNRVVCSSDYDRTIVYLREVLPFKVIEYSAGDEYNGWIIPPKWDVKEAKIIKDGRVIYDGKWHALAVISLSRSFRGKVGLEELKKHLHYDHRYDDSITFHFRQLFRSWSRDWGFCVPKTFYDALKEGEYDVIIETEESDGILKILECTHRGSLDETFIFGANLDHPGVANDGLAGSVVGIELFKRLSSKRTKFSYKLALVQGIIGSEYYLGKMQQAEREKILEGVFLEMLGSRTQLALQESMDGKSNMEYAIAKALASLGTSCRTGTFESIIINDEYIWEAYGIPMASLSRMPYPEYHSERDNLSIMSERSLNEAVEALEKAVNILESSSLVYKKFNGNICLSNPRYDLYIDPGQIAFGDAVNDETRKMRYLMDMVPTLDKPVTTRWIADKIALPESAVVEYLQKWADRGLLDIV